MLQESEALVTLRGQITGIWQGSQKPGFLEGSCIALVPNLEYRYPPGVLARTLRGTKKMN